MAKAKKNKSLKNVKWGSRSTSEDSEENANGRSSNNGAKRRGNETKRAAHHQKEPPAEASNPLEARPRSYRKRKAEETPSKEPCKNLSKRQRIEDESTEIGVSSQPGTRAKKQKETRKNHRVDQSENTQSGKI